jgi:hypothetical protein
MKICLDSPESGELKTHVKLFLFGYFWNKILKFFFLQNFYFSFNKKLQFFLPKNLFWSLNPSLNPKKNHKPNNYFQTISILLTFSYLALISRNYPKFVSLISILINQLPKISPKLNAKARIMTET